MTTITYDSPLEELAKAAVNNRYNGADPPWEFCWYGRPDDYENVCIVHTVNRDSDVLEQSNASAIDEILRPFAEDGTAVPTRYGHAGCGWVDGYEIRVYDKAGQVTEAFKTWVGIQKRLARYPVLDDEDLNNREHEDAIEFIKCCCPSNAICGLPEDWAECVSSWLWEQNIGDGYFESDSVEAAFAEMGWLEHDAEE